MSQRLIRKNWENGWCYGTNSKAVTFEIQITHEHQFILDTPLPMWLLATAPGKAAAAGPSALAHASYMEYSDSVPAPAPTWPSTSYSVI